MVRISPRLEAVEALRSRMLPPYVVIWPDDQPAVDTPPSTRFTWRPGAKELGVHPKATPELLAALAQSGGIDGVTRVDIDEWAKAMTGLPALPASVTRSLRTVTIDSARFVDWDELYRLPALTHLELGEKVKSLPDGIARLSTLTHLTIRGKRLSALPADLTSLPALTHLAIFNAPITALPDGLESLPLEALQLSWTRKLKGLPDSLGACKTLKVLEAEQVPLKTLPASVLTSASLQVLRADATKISKLGAAIRWPSLHTLHLVGTFRKWPGTVSAPELTDVCLEGRFSELPDLYNPQLINFQVSAPLKAVDPRWASVPTAMRDRVRIGLRVRCTQEAIDQLSPEERESFGSRIRAVG